MNNSGIRIPLCEPCLGPADEESVARCVKSGFVSSVGPAVTEFERSFAERVNTKYAVATASGTAAIHASLLATGTCRGKTAIVADLSFVASINPVYYCNAEALFCDIQKSSWCMDPDVLKKLVLHSLRKGIRLSAIIPVHIFGRCADLESIISIGRKFNIPVIEDATESLGTTLSNRYSGAWGTAGCFSFNGNKMITTGAGGMVVTNSRELADHVRHIVNQARSDNDRFLHSSAGFNYRMSNLAASLGLSQLQRLDEFISRKRRIAELYDSAFHNLPGIGLPSEQPLEHSCCWLYSILTESEAQREKLVRHLRENGVQSRRFFEPLHTQPYIKAKLWSLRNNRLATAEKGVSDNIASRGLNLPSSVNLSEKTQLCIIKLVKEFWMNPARHQDISERLQEAVA